MEEEKSRKKFSSVGKAVIAISLTAAVGIAMVNIGVYTWARYHSEDSGKGVATVSSDFFFLSNILKSVKDITWSYDGTITVDEALDELHGFEYVYGANDWTATTPCVFNIEMYNFENTLRYNAETLKYTMYVQMLDAPSHEDDTYEFVRYSNDHTQELGRYDLTDGKLLKIEDVTLTGDISDKNYFSLIVSPSTPDDYAPASVIVYAEITSPEYIDKSSFYLGSIFSPQAEKLKFSAEGKFDVQSEIDAGADWIESLNDLSGYIYTVQTSGEADAEHDIILYWDSAYLNFDLHNSYYTEQTILDDNSVYKERRPIEYENFVEKGKVSELPEDKALNGYTDYLVYHSPANRSSSFVFYRGPTWNMKGADTDENGDPIILPSSYENFKRLAAVRLY